jgi:Protein of unknown function (DUF3443)
MSCNRSLLGALLLMCLCLGACGSGHGSSSSSSSSSNNTQAIDVNGGPNNNLANGLFTTVTVCAPGSSNCESIPSVLVDTGSFGLRLLASAVGNLGASLPQQNGSNGNAVFECAQFVDSVLWGPVKTADVVLANETAKSVPIELIDASSVPVPSACKAIGPAEEDVAALEPTEFWGLVYLWRIAETPVRRCQSVILVSTTPAWARRAR